MYLSEMLRHENLCYFREIDCKLCGVCQIQGLQLYFFHFTYKHGLPFTESNTDKLTKKVYLSRISRRSPASIVFCLKFQNEYYALETFTDLKKPTVLFQFRQIYGESDKKVQISIYDLYNQLLW